jgi:hypothetical protein
MPTKKQDRMLQLFRLQYCAVRLECLDVDKAPIPQATATGFVLPTGEAHHYLLFTCWHVVTGLDPFNIRINGRLPRRRHIKISTFGRGSLGTGQTTVSGWHDLIVDLYRSTSPPLTPNWLQTPVHAPHVELNAIGISVPYAHDIVAIPFVDITGNVEVVQADWSPTPHQLVMGETLPGERCFIVGFPYGFSTQEGSPMPTVLSRTIASNSIPGKPCNFVLDGIAAPGMSGAPVLLDRDDTLTLLGAYRGSLYPDHDQRPPNLPSADRVTDLGDAIDLTPILRGQIKLTEHPNQAATRWTYGLPGKD